MRQTGNTSGLGASPDPAGKINFHRGNRAWCSGLVLRGRLFLSVESGPPGGSGLRRVVRRARTGEKKFAQFNDGLWAPFGITVNALGPGWFRTAQNDILFQNPDWVAHVTDKIPAGRTGLPNDMDGAIVFLASDASAYVTGQLLFVDGGFTIGAMRALPPKR